MRKNGFLLLLPVLLTALTGCAVNPINQLTAKASMPIIDGGVLAINQEQDLQLAKDAMPASIAVLEGLIIQDPNNVKMHTYAAQAYYGYAYAFVEDEDPKRASALYLRGVRHGFKALAQLGMPENLFDQNKEQIETLVAKQGKRALPALFWTASAWAKWIDMNRDKPESARHLAKTNALMQRVLALDENFYYAGPHIYFGVFYGSIAPMFGGDPVKSQAHFDKARAINQNRLLIVDLLEAEYLARQSFDQEKFHRNLTHILAAPDDLLPELAIANQIAKAKAQRLLKKEEEWF